MEVFMLHFALLALEIILDVKWLLQPIFIYSIKINQLNYEEL